MNCHGDNKEKKDAHKHSAWKHMIHMAICCGLPIVVIAALPLIAKISPRASGILVWIAPFLCPIMMITMLPMMFGHNKKDDCHENSNVKHDNDNHLELNKATE